MKTSARNSFAGKVTAVTPGAVNTQVVLKIAGAFEIVAIVTDDSAVDLGLKVGVEATALIKSSFVILAVGEGLKTSARNALQGVVKRREDGAVNSEIGLALGGGQHLVATITLESAEDLGLKPGVKATALIKASHVILAS